MNENSKDYLGILREDEREYAARFAGISMRVRMYQNGPVMCVYDRSEGELPIAIFPFSPERWSEIKLLHNGDAYYCSGYNYKEAEKIVLLHEAIPHELR